MKDNIKLPSGTQHYPEDGGSMFPQKLVLSHQTQQCHITEECNLFFTAIETQTSEIAQF
jgi:hypothetical protein